MHYYNKEHLENNILKLVVYTMGEINSKKYNLHITSIKKCKNINPQHLQKILQNLKLLNKKLIKIKKLELETFYLISLKEIDRNKYDIIKIKNMQNNKNEFYFLH